MVVNELEERQKFLDERGLTTWIQEFQDTWSFNTELEREFQNRNTFTPTDIIPQEQEEVITQEVTTPVIEWEDMITTVWETKIETPTVIESSLENLEDILTKQQLGETLTKEEETFLIKTKLEADRKWVPVLNLFDTPEEEVQLLPSFKAKARAEELKNLSDSKIIETLEEEWLDDANIEQIIANVEWLREQEKQIAEIKSEEEQAIQELETRLAEEKEEITRISEWRKKALWLALWVSWWARSSFAVSKIDEVERKLEANLNLADQKADQERQLIKARAEWAEAEVIASIQKSVDQTNAIIQSNIEEAIQASNLIKQQAWESFNKTIQSVIDAINQWWEFWEADLEITEFMNDWKVYDSFWNILKKADWTDLVYDNTKSSISDSYRTQADAYLKWESLSSFPIADRANILQAAKTLQSERWLDLTPLQTAKANQLANRLKLSDPTAIKVWLAAGKSISQIEDDLRWYNESFEWDVRNITEKIASSKWFWKEDREAIKEEVNRRVETYWADSQEVKEYLQWAALESAGQAVLDKVATRQWFIWTLLWIQQDLKDFVDAWWNTNIFTWTFESIAQKVWTTTDPELAKIARRIQSAIQQYRQNVSWAAFTREEWKEYEAVFPSIWNVPELNDAKIDALISTFSDWTNTFYRERMWASAYDNFYWGDIIPTIYPWLDLWTSTQQFDFAEDEISEIDDFFSWDTWTTTKTSSFEFKATPSWFQLKDFNLADQPAWTKGFQLQIDVPRTGTNVAKDTNNPWNITADSVPAWRNKVEYWQAIWAIWTYLSPNGREYFVFDSVDAWNRALQRDITAKVTWWSSVIQPNQTLAEFQRIYVWQENPWYLQVLINWTGATADTPIWQINPQQLAAAVSKAEWF